MPTPVSRTVRCVISTRSPMSRVSIGQRPRTTAFTSSARRAVTWRRLNASSWCVSAVARPAVATISSASRRETELEAARRRMSSARPPITVSRLLKSCAMPPDRRPSASIFCDCSSSDCVRRSSSYAASASRECASEAWKRLAFWSAMAACDARRASTVSSRSSNARPPRLATSSVPATVSAIVIGTLSSVAKREVAAAELARSLRHPLQHLVEVKRGVDLRGEIGDELGFPPMPLGLVRETQMLERPRQLLRDSHRQAELVRRDVVRRRPPVAHEHAARAAVAGDRERDERRGRQGHLPHERMIEPRVVPHVGADERGAALDRLREHRSAP